MSGCDNNEIPQARCGHDFGEALETGTVERKKQFGRVRILASGAGLALLLAVTGCGAFFQCEGKADCGTTSTGTGSTSGDYVYVSNSTTSSNYINGYSISSTGLTATTSSPYNLGFIPTAMTITPNNSFLYICSGTNIFGYSIGTGGALSILNSGTTLAAENCASLAVSPDGQWLFSLNTNGFTMEEYQITSGTGVLVSETNYTISNNIAGATALPTAVQVAPSGNYIAVSLGTAGVDLFSFVTSTGAATPATVSIKPPSSSAGDYAMAIDSNNNLYVATTSALYLYSVTSAGVPSQVSTSSIGSGPYPLALDGTTYVYSGSGTSGASISGFTISTSNPLAAVSGSPFTAPTDISAMGVDQTAGYLVAAGYNGTSGVQLFSIGSAGALTSVGTAGTGTTTTVPTVMALTHAN